MAAIASRYARAFADVVFERRLDPARAQAEIDSVAQMLEQSSDLRVVLESPGIPQAQKLALLDAIVQRAGFSRETRNFLAVIVDRRRVIMFNKIAEAVRQQINDRLGRAVAEVTTARELAPEEKRLLEAQISLASGKTITAVYSLDPALVGGVRVKVGSTVFDGSVRGQFNRLREQLVQA
jgi:F-type H+-transporting ATPase subunit delta